jgi:hypothetical protein
VGFDVRPIVNAVLVQVALEPSDARFQLVLL